MACLAFVVSALAEFAISILIQQRKNSRTESENAHESIANEKTNNSSVMSQLKQTTSPVVDVWGPCTSKLKEVAKEQPLDRFINEVRKLFSNLLKKFDIDLMAAWIYPVVFVLFNCIYWNHFYF